MKLPTTHQVLYFLSKLVLIQSHYWPNGYNRVSRHHSWSSSPVTSQNFQQQPQQLYSSPIQQQPQQLYSSPRQQQPQQLHSSPRQQPQQLYSSPSQPTYRSFSQPRSSVRQRGWPVQGNNCIIMWSVIVQYYNISKICLEFCQNWKCIHWKVQMSNVNI